MHGDQSEDQDSPINNNNNDEIHQNNVTETFNSIEYGEEEVPEIIHKSRLNPEHAPLRRMSECRIPRNKSAHHLSPTCGDSDEEFFDCCEEMEDTVSLAKWSSMDLDLDQPQPNVTSVKSASISNSLNPSFESQIQIRRVQSLREPPNSNYSPSKCPSIELASDVGGNSTCPTTFLILVAHGGSILDHGIETNVRKSDVTTFRGAFESIMRTHYPSLVGHVTVKCIPCSSICSEALAVLSSLSPYR